ncbi:MAG: hypothetical protein QE263_03930 [Vampirovibrionales bacterium]|nr:hypothetical protein [Vampirovibrionales bacterium]
MNVGFTPPPRQAVKFGQVYFFNKDLLEKVEVEKRPHTVFNDPDLIDNRGFISVDGDAIEMPRSATSPDTMSRLIEEMRALIPKAVEYNP